MKKLLLLLFVVVAFASCKESKDLDRFNPNAMITIRPDKSVNTRSTRQELTDFQIVEQTSNLTFMTNWGRNTYMDYALTLERPFKGDNMRDFSIPALKMYSTDIIDTDGSFLKDFLYGFDYYFIDNNNDTIAYIPQSVIENARIPIKTAYDEQNYTEVYRLFNEAFTFAPMPE